MLGLTFSKNVYGVDLNAQAVRVAKKNGVHAELGNVEKPWKARKNSFDIVLASHIIEHVVDTDLLITQSKQLLKRGGLLIVVTPNLAAWFNRLILLLGMQPMFTEVSTLDKTLGQQFLRRFAQHRSPVGHLRIFTPGALRELLSLHGFQVTHTTGVEFGAFPQPLKTLDQLFAFIPGLAASVIVVGKKL